MNTNDPSIEVQNLNKSYGPLTAIRNVSFQVARGEIVGFLGPNGAGKSTTMRILSGVLAADSGSAHICGIPVATHPEEVKRRIGYMPETNPLPEDMRVIEYLKYRGHLKEIPRRTLSARVDEVLEICDLKRTTSRKVIGNLSKGFRQRVGIADAILSKPEVIIMDEPTIGLDPHQVILIRELIDSLRGKMTVILSSHILAEVEVSCDRAIIINQGRIVATGTAEDLKDEFIQGTTYRISMQGDREKADRILKSVDPGFSIEEIKNEPNGSFREILAKTKQKEHLGSRIFCQFKQEKDLEIREITRLDPSLEDIFLAATKRSWDETTPRSRGKDESKDKSTNPEDSTGT